MYFEINDDAYKLNIDVSKPILRVTNPEKLKPLQKIALAIAELEENIYPLGFQCGAGDFLKDLRNHKDHFVSLVSHENKKIGYLFAWREKISLDNIENLFDDELPLSQDEISRLKEQVKPYLDESRGIHVIYISDTAVLPDFRRMQSVKTTPPIQELLGYFASWATPEPGQTLRDPLIF